MAAAAPTSVGSRANVPPGTTCGYIGEVAPAGWLLAYGQTLNKADYPALAALCGTRFGAGSATTFVMPDGRGRVIAGWDSMGGSSADRLTGVLTNAIDGDVLGASGGSEGLAYSDGTDMTNGGSASYIAAVTGGTTQPTIVLNLIIKT